MDEKEKDIIFYISFSVVLMIVCLIVANFILPKNCNIFSSNITNPQACDTNLGADCSDIICENPAIANVASAIAGLGVCSLILLPLLLYQIKNMRSRPIEQTKLFD